MERITSTSDNEIKIRKCSFAIVGAGMAGLGAARALQQMDIDDFFILEAQDKPGGRIDTLSLGDSVIDLGAQWIHGVDTHVYNVAKEHNLISNKTSTEGQGLFIRNDGHIYCDYLEKRIDMEVGFILCNCEEFVETEKYPASVGSYLSEEFQNFLSRYEKDKELKLELLDWQFRFYEVDNSCSDLKNLSAKAWGQYKGGHERTNLKDGYRTLIDCFVKTIPSDRLVLNMPIESIHYDNKSDCGVILTCKDSSEIHAEHVIVTASLGFLKHCHKTFFQPNLPRTIQDTIETMGFDGLGKVFLLFEKKWWGDNLGIQLVWTSDAFVEEELEWTRGITGFDRLVNHSNMLLGWVNHKGCQTMETLPEFVVGRHCVDVLRMFMKDYSIPYPIQVFRTTWNLNPYIRGGYSHVTSACDKAGLDAITLAEPVTDTHGIPRVVLAGEAVHRNHFSTTHGAFESGEQQVRRLVGLLERFGMEKDDESAQEITLDKVGQGSGDGVD